MREHDIDKYRFDDLPHLVGLLVNEVEALKHAVQKLQGLAPNKRLNGSQAAKHMGMSASKFHAIRNEIPVHHDGKSVYYLSVELDEWLRGNRIKEA